MNTSERNINYLNKDFNSFREQLIEFSKNYFPDTYTDFSATSPGMMFMEMAAYVGDILSFYQDNQVQETFLQYAKNPVNLYAMAYMMGYRPKVTTVSETNVTFTQILPASGTMVSGTLEYVPDWSKAVRFKQYSSLKSSTSPEVSFILRDNLDMWYSSSEEPTNINVYSWDNDTPAEYAISKDIKVFSGEIKETKFTFDNYKKFQTVRIEDSKIVGVLDAVDSDGNVWTEVPCLGQDTVFVECTGSSDLEHILTLKKVPRRFVTRFNSKGELELQFGAGIYADDAEENNFFPNPTPLLDDPQSELTNKSDIAYDPSNFLFSKSYGLAPIGILTVRYIVGGGTYSNVSANSITKEKELTVVDRTNTDAVAEYSFTNKEAASGGRDGDTVEEIRQNALRSFAEQKRIVTLEDYNVRSLAMPAKYGSISKVFATNESGLLSGKKGMLDSNPLAVTLYVLSKNMNGQLDYAKKQTKENLRTYLSNYMMVTDAIDIRDAFIVNIGVKYDIVVRPGFSSVDVLKSCTEKVQEFFRLDKQQINDTIDLSAIYSILDQVKGVQTVKSIVIENKVGGIYSKYEYDITLATRNNIVYPSYDPCIFELRYPEKDIEGRVVTL